MVLMFRGYTVPPEHIESSHWREMQTDQCGFTISILGQRGEFPCVGRAGHEDEHAFALNTFTRGT